MADITIKHPSIGHPRLSWGQTARSGGVSTGRYASLNLAGHVGDTPAHVEQNWVRFGESQHWTRETLATCEQVHGNDVLWVNRGGHHPTAADALVSTTPGLAVGVFTADCVPVLLAWPVAGVVAAVHCGWRSTAKGLLANTFREVMTNVGLSPVRCFVFVGASISQASYQVGLDVVEACAHSVPGMTPDEVTSRCAAPDPSVKGKYRYDVAGLVRLQLSGLGVLSEQTFHDRSDTFSTPSKWYSYRRDGARTGRMLSYVGITKKAAQR